MTELGQHVARVLDQGGAVAEELVAADRERAEDAPRHRHHLLAQPERGVGGDQRARALCRLDHDHQLGEGGDGAVAAREVAPVRRRPVRELADQGPALGQDSGGQLGIRRRVDDVDAGAEHGQGHPARLQGSQVGGRVHAEGQAADDHHPGLGQVGGEPLGDCLAVRRRAPGAHDRDPRPGRGRPGATCSQVGLRRRGHPGACSRGLP